MQRNTYSTIAKSFASVRSECWSSAQLTILDMVVRLVCDDLAELNPRFDPEKFMTQCRYGYGRP